MESATTTTRSPVDGAPAALPAGHCARPGDGAARCVAHVRDYISLTKPRIISLLLVTTVATMFVADPSGPPLDVILWTMLGGYLAAGGAGAINHYLDRERDARMARTRARPLVAGRIEPLHGLVFGIVLGVARDGPAGDHRQRPLRRAGARRAPGLRLRLHDVAEAADAAEHRHRRRRGSDAARWSAGRPRRARSRSTRSIPSRSSSSGRRPTSGRWRC